MNDTSVLHMEERLLIVFCIAFLANYNSFLIILTVITPLWCVVGFFSFHAIFNEYQYHMYNGEVMTTYEKKVLEGETIGIFGFIMGLFTLHNYLSLRELSQLTIEKYLLQNS